MHRFILVFQYICDSLNCYDTTVKKSKNLIKNQIQKNKEQKEREPEPALSPSLQLSEVDDISDPYNSLPIYSDEIDPDDLEYIENLSSTQISEILKDVK